MDNTNEPPLGKKCEMLTENNPLDYVGFLQQHCRALDKEVPVLTASYPANM